MSDDRHNLKLIQQIESCRPGSDDFDLPEMSDLASRLADDPDVRDLYGRVQQADAAMAAAFRDAPLPEGLQDRLLAALDNAPAASNVAPAKDLAESPSVERPTRPVRRLSAIGMLVTAAALLVAVGFGVLYFVGGKPLTVDGVLAEADLTLESMGRDWTDSGGKQPASSHPSSSRVKAKPTHWQSVAGLGDARAVAYRFGERDVTLLVFRPRASSSQLPAAPPPVPAFSSSAVAKAAWMENGLVYVLIVKGSDAQSEYRRLVDTPGFAFWRPQTLPSRHHG